MKKSSAPPCLASPGTYEQALRDGDRVLLTIRSRWPQLEGDGPGARRISRYYEALARRWQRRWEGPLLEQARAAVQEGCPPWTASLDFTVTFFEGDLLSLHWDEVEEVGQRRPRRFRQGDIWRLSSGFPVLLRDLLPPSHRWKGPVLEEISRQIQARIQTGEAIFYQDWAALVQRTFSPEQAYLTPAGPVVFFQPETIAPAMEEFPTFPLSALAVSAPDGAPESGFSPISEKT